MSGEALTVALVNTAATGGGAERVARQLLEGFRDRGHRAWLVVGRGAAEAPYVLGSPSGLQTRAAHLLAGAGRVVDRLRGLETFRYPATGRLLDVLPDPPDLVHLHNLHGGYFDLRALPALSATLPVAITLHDAWLLSGHCAHSLGCERWRTGCGDCPDLDIYPAVRRDATARNWSRKREIFLQSTVHVATPCAWLADRVRDSMLASAAGEPKVIPNGVDLEVFRPGDRAAARSALGLPADRPVLLFVGRDTGPSGFKDPAMAERAAARAAELLDRPLVLVALGEGAAERRTGRVMVRPVPFQAEPSVVARYLQAADLLLHAARADTFPSTVLESLACGTPVVATAVGGIPEQIRSLTPPGAPPAPGGGSPEDVDGRAGVEGATGILVPPGDPDAMAAAAARVLESDALRRSLAENARRDAERRFDAAAQVDAYLDWFRSILGHGGGGR